MKWVRAWSFFQTRNGHLFWHMFTSPVLVSWPSWKHTECLMWNHKKFVAFYCKSIWPDFEFWAWCSWLLLCFLSSIKALQQQISIWVCLLCTPASTDISISLSLYLSLALLSTTSSWPPEQRTSVSQSCFTPFKSHLKALQWQQMPNAHTSLIHFLHKSPTAL